MKRSKFLKLPMETRRAILKKCAEKLIDHY